VNYFFGARVRRFKLSQDPAFAAKLQECFLDVQRRVYVSAVIVCAGGTSGMSARGHSADPVPTMSTGRLRLRSGR
jgi:hypothetical protein